MLHKLLPKLAHKLPNFNAQALLSLSPLSVGEERVSSVRVQQQKLVQAFDNTDNL